MIRRNTWILLAIFLVGLGGIFWYNRQGNQADLESQLEPTAEPLWFIPEVEIRELFIQDLEQGNRVRARRDAEEGWTLLEPAGEMADIARIERAVTSLQLITPIDRIQTESYAQYGLEQPRYQILLSLTDDSNKGLMIGRQAPTGDVYYAKIGESGQVLLLRTGSIQSALDLLETPPIVTPTPEATQTAGADGG